ncbi:hypothetical protein [Kitasatospora sp. GP82]|uniref:hypothetical protein n=1 Tax=Kitasatospora sp. GP82 TaxID=3035089 RepID=UPI002473CF1C|nr:hypothetical protein [Kitasatospora sp. GP82]MDH6127451.1 putative outer membrane repeat protein [Kitasatospora sp. GP82]
MPAFRAVAGVAMTVAATTAFTAAPTAAPPDYSKQVRCDADALKGAINRANAAGGGTLELAHHCTYTLKAPDNDSNGLPVITSRITIDGNDATIQRDPMATPFRIFEIAGPPLTGPTGPAGDLTAKDLTIKGGNLTDFSDTGAGVRVDAGGTLRLTDSTVTGNTNVGQGGGISNLGRTVLVHSTVTDNSSNRDGGGIYSNGALNLTKGSELTSNSASVSGGALRIDGGTAEITHTTFHSNTAGDGGAVHVNGGSPEFDDSVITGNTSRGSAGGLDLEIRTVLRRTRVENNTAGRDGGGIWAVSAVLDDVQVTGNRANDRRGGGIFNAFELTVKNSRITGNQASGQGGGVFDDSGTAATVSHTRVSDNAVTGSPGQGGGFWNNGTLALDEVEVTDNRATAVGGEGGGIYNIGGDGGGTGVNGNLLLTRTEVVRNTAGTGTSGTNAGGVWTNKALRVFQDSTIRSNHPTNCVDSPVRPDSCTN